MDLAISMGEPKDKAISMGELKDEAISLWGALSSMLLLEKEKQEYLGNAVWRSFSLKSNDVYYDAEGGCYVVNAEDGTYIITRDLNFAKLVTEDPEEAAKVLLGNTLDGAGGPWRFCGGKYDKFGSDEDPSANWEGEFKIEEVGDDDDESDFQYFF
ncbi:hypothetical protein K440DRAFT_73503 [Wilcoxina mikolae CBS 423.85]|nr:hypothetical protein K440DRAFT_73503 [Wilcoxina mikolae CBS 423.85]